MLTNVIADPIGQIWNCNARVYMLSFSFTFLLKLSFIKVNKILLFTLLFNFTNILKVTVTEYSFYFNLLFINVMFSDVYATFMTGNIEHMHVCFFGLWV